MGRLRALCDWIRRSRWQSHRRFPSVSSKLLDAADCGLQFLSWHILHDECLSFRLPHARTLAQDQIPSRHFFFIRIVDWIDLSAPLPATDTSLLCRHHVLHVPIAPALPSTIVGHNDGLRWILQDALFHWRISTTFSCLALKTPSFIFLIILSGLLGQREVPVVLVDKHALHQQHVSWPVGKHQRWRWLL